MRRCCDEKQAPACYRGIVIGVSQPNHDIHARRSEGVSASAKGFPNADIQVCSVAPGDAAPRSKVGGAQKQALQTLAHPALQMDRAGPKPLLSNSHANGCSADFPLNMCSNVDGHVACTAGISWTYTEVLFELTAEMGGIVIADTAGGFVCGQALGENKTLGATQSGGFQIL